MEGRLKAAGREAIPSGGIQTLPLRELEAFSRSRLPVFLSFLHPRIARQESGLLQNLPKLGAEIHQSTRYAVLHGAGLTMHSATPHTHNNIELAERIGSFKGLPGDHLVGLIEEVLIYRLVIDR